MLAHDLYLQVGKGEEAELIRRELETSASDPRTRES